MSFAPDERAPALAASEACCRAIIEKNADGIIIVGRQGIVRFVNPAAEALLGRPAAEIVGSAFGVPVMPGETTELDVLRGGGQETAVAEMRVVETTWEGETVHLASLRDVTERKRTEEALQKANDDLARANAALKEADRRKDEFLATLAHELRNPLAPIRNSLHILRMAGTSNGAAERVQEMMERQVNHMVRLVDDLLELSRITRGKIELRKEPVELAAVIGSAVETSRPLIEAARHRLAITLPPQPLTVQADPVRLSQVIANLLNNSGKYTAPGGQIWLSARVENGAAVISVRDNGLGIPAEMLARVFDIFTQVDRTDGHTHGGLGIGLALVKSLVELHGGRVEAHSAGPGQGSEFIIRLPLVAPRAPSDGAADHVLPPARLANRILVVDDNRDAADSMGMMLEMLGNMVRIANDGPAALEIIAAWRPAVVLLDIGMPGMSGYEVAQWVRARPELDGVVLIALTGWGQEEDRRRSREAGIDHHLVKPADMKTLTSLLVAFQNNRTTTAHPLPM